MTELKLPEGWTTDRAQREINQLAHDEAARIKEESERYQFRWNEMRESIHVALCDLAEVLRKDGGDRLPANLGAVVYATNVPAGICIGRAQWLHAPGGLLPRPLLVAPNLAVEAQADDPATSVQLLAVVFKVPA